MSRYTLMGLLGALLVLFTQSAGAVDRNWIDTGAGLNNWNDAANWNPSDDFAQAGDNALFDQNATYTVIVQAPSAANVIKFTDGNVTLGGGTLNSGGFASIDDAFAVGLGDGAIVTLSGATWDSAGDAIIGNTGFGTLTINSGSDFEANRLFIGNQAGGTGEVTVTGTGSMLTASLNSNVGIFTIGNNGGTGTINVLDDADLRTTSTGGNDIWVGSGVDPGDANNVSTGTLNVDGAGSFAEAEDLNVGIFGGTGFLNITNGGQVILTDGSSSDTAFGANDAVGGSKSSGTGVVDGDGSLLQSRDIFVGSSGSGALQVSNGGVAQTLVEGASFGAMIIGDGDGSDGQVAVYGADVSASLLDVDESLFVGNAGLGVLRIGQELDGTANGTGALQVDEDLVIGDDVGNLADNRVVVDGANATATVGDVVFVGLNGRGAMDVIGGGVVNDARGRAGSGTDAEGTVLVDGRGSQWNSSTNLFIGASGKGRVTVSDGGLVNAGNTTLAIGANNGSDGQITVTGVDDNGTPGNTVDDLRSTLKAAGGAELYIGGFTGQSNALGKLGILDGGLVIAREDNFIGGTSGSDGWLLVSGVNANGFRSTASFDDNSPIGNPNDITLIGSASGEGRVEVSDGGLLDVERLEVNGGPADATLFGLAQPFGETILVSGENDNNTPGNLTDDIASEINVQGRIEIGDTRTASMRIEDGAQVISNTIIPAGGPSDSLTFIGTGAAADNSSVVITGTGSKWFDAYDPIGDVQDDNDFVVAGSATGVLLDIEEGGALQTGRGVIARSSGSSGSVTITGAGSRWDATSMIIGNIGVGTLTVENGGTVVSAGLTELGNGSTGDGTLTVRGSGSSSTAVTYSVGDVSGGVGTFTAILGGTVTATDTVNLGEVAGSTGDATIGTVNPGDAESTLDVDNNLNVGGNNGGAGGTGLLNVEASGKVSVTNLTKVFSGGTVNLNGGTIETDLLEVVQVGDFNFNTGTLRFTGSKTLDVPALDGIFDAPTPTLGANQHLAVDGAATLDAPLRLNDSTATLSIGTINDLANLDWDAGTLNITNQNVVVGVGGLFGQSVIVDQNQSLGIHNNNLSVQANADLHIVRGGLHTVSATNDSNGLIVLSNTANVDFDTNNNDAGLTNNGDLVMINSTIAGAIVNNGSIEIVGTVNFTDGVTLMAGGSLGIDIDGLLDFDAISVGGDLSLDGLLNVDVSDFLLSSGGDTFEIIDVDGALSGTFAGLADGALVGNFGGFDFFIDYDGGDGNDVVLFTDTGVDVDLDNDGDVDGADFLAIQRTNPALIPDWELQYGSGSPIGAATATVPEPTTVWLALIAFVALGGTFREAIPARHN